MREVIPLVKEQRDVINHMRKVYQNIFSSNDPSRFKVRVTKASTYSHQLRVDLEVVDYINDTLLPDISKIFD